MRGTRTYTVRLDNDLHLGAYRAGWDWAEAIWDQTPPEQRKKNFPRTAEQAYGVPVRYRRSLTEREAAVVAHFVHEAAQQKWAELYTGSQPDGGAS